MYKEGIQLKPRILYLYWMVSMNGRDHIACRRLVDALSNEYEVTLKCSVLPDDSYLNATDRAVLAECIPEADFIDAKYNLVILEQCVGEFKNAASLKVRALALE